MAVTDTTERGLEALIVRSLTDEAGYVPGDPADFDRDYAVDLVKLVEVLQATQPRAAEQLRLEADGPDRRKFLARLQGEIAKRGIIDVLRSGVQHGPVSVTTFYGQPSAGNAQAEQRYAANLFSVTRQLRYSKDERTCRQRRKQVFPRYHQLDVVYALLADVRVKPAGLAG